MRVTDNGLFPPFEGDHLLRLQIKKSEGGKHPFLIFFIYFTHHKVSMDKYG